MGTDKETVVTTEGLAAQTMDERCIWD